MNSALNYIGAGTLLSLTAAKRLTFLTCFLENRPKTQTLPDKERCR